MMHNRQQNQPRRNHQSAPREMGSPRDETFPSCLSSETSFDDPTLNLSTETKACAARMNLAKLSTIQAATIPRLFNGDHIIARASTGCGKTLAFTLGMLRVVEKSNPLIQCICVAPVREIASQIYRRWVEPFAHAEGITSALVVRDAEKRAGQIIVGTPGTVKTSFTDRRGGWPEPFKKARDSVKMLVLDEADAFLNSDDGGRETEALRRTLGSNIQIACFSATFPPDVVDLMRTLLRPRDDTSQRRRISKLFTAPEPLGGGRGGGGNAIMQMRLDLRADPRSAFDKKVNALLAIYTTVAISKSIVFVKERNDAVRVAEALAVERYTVSFTHGKLEPIRRDEEIAKFERGDTNVLVCTNLDRGIDIPEVGLVINFNVPVVHQQNGNGPPDMVQFVHRIGRCSRWGKPGTAITLVATEDEERALEWIEEGIVKDRGMTEVFAPGALRLFSKETGPDYSEPPRPITEGATVTGIFRGDPKLRVSMGKACKVLPDGSVEVAFEVHNHKHLLNYLKAQRPPEHRVSSLWVGSGAGVDLQAVVQEMSNAIEEHAGSASNAPQRTIADDDANVDEDFGAPDASIDAGTAGPAAAGGGGAEVGADSLSSSTPLKGSAKEFVPSVAPGGVTNPPPAPPAPVPAPKSWADYTDDDQGSLEPLGKPWLKNAGAKSSATVDGVTEGIANVSVSSAPAPPGGDVVQGQGDYIHFEDGPASGSTSGPGGAPAPGPAPSAPKEAGGNWSWGN